MNPRRWWASSKKRRGIKMAFRLLLASFLVGFADANVSSCGQPKHVHLAVGQDPSTSMTVSFASNPCRTDSMIPSGAVVYGTSPDRMDHAVVAQSQPFRDNFEMFPHHSGRPRGNYTSDYYHHVHLEDLEPNQKYYYKCLIFWGDFEHVSIVPSSREEQEEAGRFLRTSRELVPSDPGLPSFWTAPPPGQATKHNRKLDGVLKLAILGDLGFLQRSKETMATLTKQRKEINAVILAGDIAYPRSRPEGWDMWFDVMDTFKAVSELPIQIAAGNHDVEARMSGDIFMEYENRFSMPRVREAEMKPYELEKPMSIPPLNLNFIPYPLDYEYGNSYYSFIYGVSHNIIINSYACFDPGCKQYDWLVSELRSVDRTLTPWLFVTLHVPMYNTFHFHHKDIQLKKAKEHLEALFVEYRVNVVFSGHIHAYMRTHPVVNDKRDAKGPVHIIVGDGGRDAEAPFKSWEPEEWVAVRDATYFGYGTIEVYNETHAQWEWVHSGIDNKTNYVWHPRPRHNETVEEITYPPVERDSALIMNQYFL